MIRTIGSAIGLLILVFFMAYLATRLSPSLSASARPAAAARR